MSTVSITKESLPDFLAGNGTIGTAEGKVSAVNFPICKSLTLRADSANTSTIKVGRPGNSANGFVLAASNETTIYADQTDKVAIVGGAANQAYSWVAA